MALTGTNSYTGNTLLNAGVIQINNPNSLGTTSSNAVFGGGSVQLLANVVTTRNYQTDGNNAATADVVIDTNGNTLDLSGGTITPFATGTGGLVKNGAGTLTLGSAVNTYTGTTTINAGTVAISANTALGDLPTAATLNLNGGTLEATATSALDNGTNLRNVTIGASNGGINTDSGANLTVNGVLSGSGTLIKSGAGTLTLTNTGNTANMNITGGTLTAGYTTANTNGGLGTGTIVIEGGGTLSTIEPVNNTIGLTNTINVPAGQVGTFNTPNRLTLAGPVTGGGTLNLVVSTTVTRLNLDNSFAGFNGNLNMSGGGTAELSMNNGTTSAFNAAGFASTSLDLEGTVFLDPLTNSTGNTVTIGALSGSSTTAGLDGGSAGTVT